VMAVEKIMGAGGIPVEEGIAEQIDVIEQMAEPGQVALDDGSMLVGEITEEMLMAEPPVEIPFDANLAEYIDESALQTLASDIVGDIEDDTVVINGNTHTLKADGTSDSASVCDITGAATIAPATFTLTLGAVPLDGEILTVNGRTYEFDTDGDGIGASDVEIDTNGDSTGSEAAASLVTDFNNDGSREYNAAADGYVVTFTAITQGVAANSHVLSEDLTDCFLSGTNPTGGADATGAEIATIFLTHLQNAGAETTITPSAGGSGEVVLTYDIGGTAGDAITLTETLTAGSCDGGGTFGGTTSGVDCTAANAVTAIVAAVTGGDTQGVGAADGAGDTVVFTADTPGTAGDSITTTESPAADAVTALVSAITSNDTEGVGAADGTGDVVDLTADNKGTAANSIGTTTDCGNASFGNATLTGGDAGTQAGICAALETAINGDGSATWGATDNLDNTVTITADAKGTAGNSITTTETCGNANFGGGTLSGGHAGTAAGTVTALVSAINTNDTEGVAAVDGAGDTVDLTADTAGTAANSIGTTTSMANASFGDSTLTGGVDGTVGVKGEIRWDGSYIYVCTLANTVADANWERAAISSY